MSSPARWRIAQLLESDGPGGAENVVVHLSRRLHELGAHIVVYVPARGQGWLRAQLEGSGVQFEVFDIERPFSPRFAKWLAASFETRKIHVAHNHEFSFAVYGAWAGRLAGVPQVTTMHGGRYYAEALRRRIALGIALRATAEPVAVSEVLKNHLTRDLFLPPESISVIPNGIPNSTAVDPGIRASLGLASSARLVVAIGNLYPVKGHGFLIEALHRIAGRHPEACLLIAGRGEELEPLRSLAQSLGMEKRVYLLGLRDDVPALLAAADVFALPSLSEGLPIAILEAMFAAKPIVASDVGDIGMALGGFGRLVPPGNVDALATALDQVLSDPVAARKMGESARSRATAEYSVDHMAARYTALYQRALERK
jgi:glycosyltransferase involved in cell wall biosynthesis